jgi:hypothetical protein
MTHENVNKSGINLNMKNGQADNGYDEENDFPTVDGGKLNKTNISMISAKSMSQLSNQHVRLAHPELKYKTKQQQI